MQKLRDIAIREREDVDQELVDAILEMAEKWDRATSCTNVLWENKFAQILAEKPVRKLDTLIRMLSKVAVIRSMVSTGTIIDSKKPKCAVES